MKIIRILIGILMLQAVGIAAASDTPYRLAGSIVTSDPGKRLALIETADGTQLLLRKGDSIDGGSVVEITENSVRLQFEKEEIVLKLAGTDNPDVANTMQYRLADYPVSEQKLVNPEALGAISELAKNVDKNDSNELAAKILSYLNLPAETRIMAVDGKPVASPAEALREMAGNIDSKANMGEGFRFRIAIAGTGGNRRVYVFADAAGEISDQTTRAN